MPNVSRKKKLSTFFVSIPWLIVSITNTPRISKSVGIIVGSSHSQLSLMCSRYAPKYDWNRTTKKSTPDETNHSIASLFLHRIMGTFIVISPKTSIFWISRDALCQADTPRTSSLPLYRGFLRTRILRPYTSTSLYI